jgi:hypothetical protein
MTTVQPPLFAARLLKRLVPVQDHDALLGDLYEEYQRRRSLAWYWLQIFAAIIVGSWKDIRTHRLLTLRAIVTGVASCVVYLSASFLMAELISAGLRRLGDGILIGNHWIHWRNSWQPSAPPLLLAICVFAFLFYVGFLVRGRAVGRLNRSYGILLALTLVTAADIVFMPLLSLRVGFVVSHHVGWHVDFVLTYLAILTVSGWTVGRLHRAHGITLVLAFAAIATLQPMAQYEGPPAAMVRVSFGTLIESALLIARVASVLIGGYFATRRVEAA